MHCSDLFASKVRERDSPILLGLDPDDMRIPQHLPGDTLARVGVFCRALIKSCAPHVCGLKIQLACFEQYGSGGVALAEQLIQQARELGLLVVMDGKRGDIAATAAVYARAYLHPDSPLAGDALTVNPWLGADSLEPFIQAASEYNRLLFVLVHTSNPDAAMFQSAARERLTGLITNWNADDRGKNQCGRMGAVIGATNVNELASWHERLPASWLLTPGLGAQQGDAGVLSRLRAGGANLLAPISRAILYAGEGEDFAQRAASVAADYRAKLHS